MVPARESCCQNSDSHKCAEVAIFRGPLGFAQSGPFLGAWQLNVSKSKYSSGQPPKSQTWYIRDEGNNRKNSQVTIMADGVPSALVFIHIYDDNPRPVPGAQGY